MGIRWVFSAAGAAAVLAAAGCSTAEKPPVRSYLPSDAQAGLALPRLDIGLAKPPLHKGDTFVFDNPPEQWTVISIEGPFVGWQSTAGDYMQTAWSTLLPPLRWGGGSANLDSGLRRIGDLNGSLFPLKTGNKVSFVEHRTNARPAGSFTGRWECEVGQPAEVVVPAGKAQTWEVTCLVDGHERMFFNYSEDIGHYVRYAIDTSGGPIIRQLTGYARGKPAQAPAASSPAAR